MKGFSKTIMDMFSSRKKAEESEALPEDSSKSETIDAISTSEIKDATPLTSSPILEASKVMLLSIILKQAKQLNNNISQIEKDLAVKEQISEAAQAESFLEKPSSKTAKKIKKDGSEEDDKKESSLFFTICKNILGLFLVFLPVIMKFMPKIKEAFNSISDIVHNAFKDVFKFISEKLEDLLNKNVFDKIKEFFNTGVKSVWDMFISAMEEGFSIVVQSVSSFIKEDLLNQLTEGKYTKQEIKRSIEILEKSGYKITAPPPDAKPVARGPSTKNKSSEVESTGIDSNKSFEVGSTFSKEKDAKKVKSNTIAVSKEIPPEGRALLDAIAEKESSGRYDIIVGMGTEQGLTAEDKAFNKSKGYDKAPATITDFSKHPGIRGMRTSSGPSTAAGRYQITESTWKDLKKRHSDLIDFSPENQDKAAWYLIQERYKGDILEDLRSGKIADVGRILNRTWTSLAGGIESKQSDQGLASLYRSSLERQVAAETGKTINEASFAANVPEPEMTAGSVIVVNQPSAIPSISGTKLSSKNSTSNPDIIQNIWKRHFQTA